MKVFVSAIATLMVFPSLSFAARPLTTDDAGTVEKGVYEIEYAIDYSNGFDNETAMSLLIKRGIFDNLDLGVQTSYAFIDAKEASDSDGFGDVGICTKFNLIHNKEFFPDTSISFTYTSDSGNDDRGLGAGKPQYSLNSIFSKRFNSVGVHVNIGYVFREDFKEEDNEDTLTCGFALEYPLNEQCNLVGEIFGETALRGKFHDNLCSALFGLNYALNDSLALDFGVGTEISRADADFKITAGITIDL